MENIVETHVYASITMGGKEIPFITDAVVSMWVVVAAIMVLVLVLTRKLKTVPDGKQNVAEVAVEFITNMTKGQIEHHWKPFVPYLGTVLFFLTGCNLLALFNVIPSGETLARILHIPALSGFHFSLHPPTKNFNVTVCLALISIAVVIYAEFRYRGLKGWVRSFYKPTPISAFIKVLDYCVRPMSLCLRLFGNILGATIVMALIYSAMPLFVPAAVGIYFDLFDGALQAYVFVFLTMLYIAEAVEEEE